MKWALWFAGGLAADVIYFSISDKRSIVDTVILFAAGWFGLPILGMGLTWRYDMC